MAASTTTSAVYIHVIEDVISKVRDEFVNSGESGEIALTELQAIWETKMMHAGVLSGPIGRSFAQKPTPGGSLTPMHDLNVPYEGNEEYETPTAEMLFPPTPLQTPAPTPLPASTPHPGSSDNSTYNYPTPAVENGINNSVKGLRPSPYMQIPSPWANQRPHSVDVNIAPIEGQEDVDRGNSSQPLAQDLMTGKRKRDNFSGQYSNGGYIPQLDGAGDFVPDVNQGGGSLCEGDTDKPFCVEIQSALTKSSLKIPQMDGPNPDIYDEMLSTPNIFNYQGGSEDYNIANTPAPNENTPVPVQNEIKDEEDDDESLNEDDDDEDDLDDINDEEDMNTQHLVLAQFDKVTRTKSRWKCTLKDGIMHINNKDILFNKATGEFDF
ncbi:PREDICTED: transcription initiation factor IIA large subunit-like [Tarenaya hassleriana]|uniref:transcription initiation factor IIA large subunit-like n=1 Tax=Tarenaya hassleriana TaxID=28532 RepID=UPI00053C8BEB|nr:PREDICTED: transcription initiation factor IIA large subunit-like [Tarenaya hassleriana]